MNHGGIHHVGIHEGGLMRIEHGCFQAQTLASLSPAGDSGENLAHNRPGYPRDSDRNEGSAASASVPTVGLVFRITPLSQLIRAFASSTVFRSSTPQNDSLAS